MEIVDRLLEFIKNDSDLNCIHSNVLDIVKNPQFEKVGKVHDWRNYIPDCMIDVWDVLSLDAKIACFIMAAKEANSEDWDEDWD